MYTVYACETVTGKTLGTIDCAVPSWGRVLNGIDTASIVLSPGALTVKTKDMIRLLTDPVRMSIVVDWDGIPLVANPIWTRAFDGSNLTINSSGLRSILTRRKAIHWLQPYVNQSLTFSGMSLGSIAASLVQVATEVSKAGASLPILLPTFENDSDSSHERTYNGFDLGNVGDILGDITGVINGPDIDFLPYWVDGDRSAIGWRMRIGTDEKPMLGAPNPFPFDATQPASSVRLLTVTEDASSLATAQWGKGSGADVDSLISFAASNALTAAGWPLLEQEDDYTSVTVQATLDASVAGDLAANSTPLEQWGLTVDITKPPTFGTYNLGDPLRVNVQDHVWLLDGDYPMRLVGMTGDSSTSVELQVQGG